MKKISFVIPAFNEASNIVQLHQELTGILNQTQYQFEFIFVDDGSTDGTLEIIKKLAARDNRVYYIELSRNFGHQNALKAGLDTANGDSVISMDCDLQHPPTVVLRLIEKWESGYDIVYTKRSDVKTLPLLKRLTSSLFYKFHNWLSDEKLTQGAADFRLMSRNSLIAFRQIRESDLFLRGLVKWTGFRQFCVEYDPHERFSGETKYSFKKMVSFAFKGITSFSVRPLKLVAYVGITFFLFSTLLIPYALISYFLGKTVSGWTSIMISIIFFGSLQLLMLGIIALYVGKIMMETKQRPQYFVRETNYSDRH